MPNEPPSVRRTWITCLGDANDPQAWSSIPYHVLTEGIRQGSIDAGVVLRPDAPWVGRSRTFWNVRHVLTGHRPGGFQYSNRFLERLWRESGAAVAGCDVISTFQILPRSLLDDRSVRRWFYLDGTLRQLVEHYGHRLDPRWRRDVYRRETEGYQTAAGVFTMSRFAADSVIRDYGVEPARVHVVVPGANITADLYDRFEPELVRINQARQAARRDGTRPLRLVFVGREAVRKGADRLLRALRIGRPRGLKMTLRVIGISAADVAEDLRGIDGVEWLGVISRRTDTDRLFRLIAGCDIGCLLSRAEMAGISIRESLAMGQPVLGPAAGGSPDLMPPGLCWSVAPDDSDEAIADQLLAIEADVDGFARRQAACWAARREALWEPAVRIIGEKIGAARSA